MYNTFHLQVVVCARVGLTSSVHKSPGGRRVSIELSIQPSLLRWKTGMGMPSSSNDRLRLFENHEHTKNYLVFTWDPRSDFTPHSQ
jgi:hypothetical protein